MNKSGEPAHPLYLKADLKPVPMEPNIFWNRNELSSPVSKPHKFFTVRYPPNKIPTHCNSKQVLVWCRVLLKQLIVVYSF